MMTRHKTRPSYQRGIDAALALLKAIGRKDGPSRVSDVALALHIPHASVYRIIRTLAEHSLVVSTGRGWIAPGPTWATLARRYEDAVRGEDERSRMRKSFRSSVRGAACSFPGNPHPYVLASDHNFRRSPKYRIGFANAALDSPWRTALVHAVEFGAARRRDLVGSLFVRHAARSVARQVTDLESLIEAGVDGLVVSALDVDAISPIMGRAAERGIPTVLVDRGRAGTGPHVSFVACDNWMIGWTMAQWLCEHIAGRGGIVMLSGDRSADPPSAGARVLGPRSRSSAKSGSSLRSGPIGRKRGVSTPCARRRRSTVTTSPACGATRGFRRPDRSAPASRRDGGRYPRTPAETSTRPTSWL